MRACCFLDDGHSLADTQGMKKEALKNDIIVIGGGLAGVEAAIAAAPYADSVAIISEGPVGGWGKLMPPRP